MSPRLGQRSRSRRSRQGGRQPACPSLISASRSERGANWHNRELLLRGNYRPRAEARELPPLPLLRARGRFSRKTPSRSSRTTRLLRRRKRTVRAASKTKEGAADRRCRRRRASAVAALGSARPSQTEGSVRREVIALAEVWTHEPSRDGEQSAFEGTAPTERAHVDPPVLAFCLPLCPC